MSEPILVSKKEFDAFAREIYTRKISYTSGAVPDAQLELAAEAAVRAAHMWFSKFDELTIEQRKAGMK